MIEEGIEWVGRAIRLGNENYPLFAENPRLDHLRGDARFQTLLDNLRRRWEEQQ
jgi:hypothetical protein